MGLLDYIEGFILIFYICFLIRGIHGKGHAFLLYIFWHEQIMKNHGFC